MSQSLPAIPVKRYFTIGEVAQLCGVKPHVLRYWEQEFTQLRPMKRQGNRRYYQHHEVLMIRRILMQYRKERIIMLKLSVTTKLDGIKSWSLQAIETCPASIGADGELVDACKGCYATTGNYRYGNVKAPREFNREDWKRDAWVSDMVQTLQNDRYFRWFDSGDMYDMRLAEKIYEVMQKTPWVSHWLPTRMAKFPKFQGIIAKMQQLPNVAVRFSSDAVDGSFVPGVHGSTIVPPRSARGAFSA